MSLSRSLTLGALLCCSVTAAPLAAQERVLSFSVSGGAAVLPKYFGSDEYRVGPTGGLRFNGLQFGNVSLGTPGEATLFPLGGDFQGSLRFIPKREGKDELEGLEDVKASLELGFGARYTEENWQVFGAVRYGVFGHNAIAGELGANVIYRAPSGLIFSAGPRAEFGNGRFNRTYFGVTDDESAASASGLQPFRPSSGFHSIGLEADVYQPLSDNWGLTGGVRYDRLMGEASDSPIVQQGSRNQFRAEIGLTRHFNLRF